MGCQLQVINSKFRNIQKNKKVYSRKALFNLKKAFLSFLIAIALNISSSAQILEGEDAIELIFAEYIDSNDFEEDFKSLKKEYEIGPGILILKEYPRGADLLKLNTYLSGLNYGPLVLISSDTENSSQPKPLTIGALDDERTLAKWAIDEARQLKKSSYSGKFGLFPGIANLRTSSHGITKSMNEDWEHCAEKSSVLLSGTKSEKLINVATHFPGFYNFDNEGSLSISLTDERIMNMEAKAYSKILEEGIEMVHMSSALVKKDQENFEPFFLSSKWINKHLKKDMKYDGLVMSSSISEVSQWYDARNGELELNALLAGNDIILSPENVKSSKRKIRQARKKNKKLDNRIADNISRLEKLGLNLVEKEITEFELPRSAYWEVINKSFVIKDEAGIIPIKDLEIKNIAAVHVGDEISNEVISEYLDKYARVKHFNVRDRFNYYEKFEELIEKLDAYETIIIPLGNIPYEAANNYGLGDQIPKFIESLQSQNKKLIVLSRENPIVMDLLPQGLSHLHSFESNYNSDKSAAQVLFGAKGNYGKMPYSMENFAWNEGVNFESAGRLDYAFPEEVNMDPDILLKLEEVIDEALDDKATPGCQLLIAKNGHIVLEKGYGYLSYDSLHEVNSETVYDIASITKVAATLQAVMFLSERGVIDINAPASDYLVELKGSNKEDLIIADILGHQAGLTPYIPHWKKTLSKKGIDESFYCDQPDSWFCHEVVPGMYAIRSMEDSLWQWTIDSELINKRNGKYPYKYSDLGFYIMKKLVERMTRQPIEEFLEQNFYMPLGMSKLTFFPKAFFDASEIAPTEEDDYFRNEIIRGTVHDQGAAMFGGVGGHAGLFSNTNDLAKLLQMNMNGGKYGGQEYFKKSTLGLFTDRHFKNNRRGLGWDKPLRSGNGPTSDLCSYNTFGHTGFTGTAMWADPDYDLIFVFLSNRIHPDVNNRALIKQNIRTRIQDIVYESIFINDANSRKK